MPRLHPVPTIAAAEPRCDRCVYFRNDPAHLETVFAGLGALGSAYGSVRAEDGLCDRHDRYLSAHARCADFLAKVAQAVSR